MRTTHKGPVCYSGISLTRLVLELLDGLHCPVVVIEVDAAHHLAALYVADAQTDAADHVTVDQFHDLRCRREFGIDLLKISRHNTISLYTNFK